MSCWDIRCGWSFGFKRCLRWRRIPTTKTLTKVTMSKKTTMTTVHHRLLRLVWSYLPFPPWYRCRLLDRVVRLCISLCNRPFPTKARCEVNLTFSILSISTRNASILDRACAFGTALPLGGAPRLFRHSIFCGTQTIFCFLEVLWYIRVSITSTRLNILQS